MAQYELNTTQIALLEALKASLFGIEPNYPEDTDWAEVVKEAKAQTVMGIISPVIPVTDTSTKQGIAKYIQILHEQDKLIKLFDENDIPCVILKGSAAAIYYPNPHLRTMGDVDILVSRSQFNEASEIMEANGYIYVQGKDDNGKRPEIGRHFEYHKNSVVFELHHHFSSVGFDVDDILEQAICKPEYRELDGYMIPMLPDIENGLVLLGHIHIHLKHSNLGLRQVIDWQMYVHRVLDDDTWRNLFEPIVKSVGFDKLAVITTKMCETFLGLPNDNSWCKNIDVRTSKELLSIILSSGNFGWKMYSSRSERHIHAAVYEIKQKGIHTFLKELGLRKSKVCRNNPILNHFVWLYGLICFIYMGFLAVARTKNVRKRVLDVNERLEILEELGLKDFSS
ncbi:hypothetical protein RASY3_02375 [Ruminococcus albus SY3]|uniref:Nucleotidyltransferase n=1 Tax=Ruminococcus albus SY3 TaxID=1341156 RepID=A0A011W0B7_RUMAL|nr:nucleotidyltransferase family protein [Ruminococcus albus]EXM40991.1 hypothetical protein RASY3_02375 [Ruminococcus albus SY3]